MSESLDDLLPCPRCDGSGVEPGTVVIPTGHGSGFNSLDPDPLDRGSYVPCSACHGPYREPTHA